MPAMHGGEGEDEELVAFDRIAKEPHPRLVVADAADDRAELARDDPGRQQIAQPQRQRRGPEEPDRDDRLRRRRRARACSAGPTARCCRAARCRSGTGRAPAPASSPGSGSTDRRRSPGCGTPASRRPAPAGPAPARPAASCSGDCRQRPRSAGNSPTPTTPKIWLPMASMISLGGRRDRRRWPARLRPRCLGARIHQPHADHVAAEPEEGEMAQARMPQ